jgi:hypothetical protein
MTSFTSARLLIARPRTNRFFGRSSIAVSGAPTACPHRGCRPVETVEQALRPDGITVVHAAYVDHCTRDKAVLWKHEVDPRVIEDDAARL